jgi:hypothetical protein
MICKHLTETRSLCKDCKVMTIRAEKTKQRQPIGELCEKRAKEEEA